MKAKEYYEKLKQCTTRDQFYAEHDRMMHDLITEVEILAKERRVISDSALEACLKEINQKYKAICNLHAKKKDSLPDDCYLKNVDFDKEIFLSLYSKVTKV